MSECQSQPFCDEAKERVKEIEAELEALKAEIVRANKEQEAHEGVDLLYFAEFSEREKFPLIREIIDP